MDYHKLLQRLAELDQPTTESAVKECGEMIPPSAPSAPPPAPPSMTVNLNAQGMDNIEQLMKLMTKVNPDMAKPTSIVADPHPVTMLAPPIDMDGEEDGELEKDKSEIAPVVGAMGTGLSRAVGSAAVDMMSDDDVENKETYANEPDEEYKDIDYITNKVAGGLNKPQGTYPKVSGGDNPMQKITRMEGTELRAAIRAELLQRLAEAKGAK
jgi:hypothetical protein